MWFECSDCEFVWEKKKYYGKPESEIKPDDIKLLCPNCSSEKVNWVLNPLYRKSRRIGLFYIDKMVSLDKPAVRSRDKDPRGPIEIDPRIFLTTRKYDNEKYMWLPYWITINGQKKFGQSSPIIKEKNFVQLITKSLEEDFFSEESLERIQKSLDKAKEVKE